METLTQTASPTRFCSGPCGRELPLESFRRNRKGSERREADCNDCHKLALRERNRRRRERTVDRFVRSGYFQRLDRKLRRLTCTVISRLGGVEPMATLWVQMIQRAQKDRPGCPFVLASMMSLARLLEFTNALAAKEEAQRGSTDELSNDELADVIRRHVIALVQELPELVLVAADELGWQVSPPQE